MSDNTMTWVLVVLALLIMGVGALISAPFVIWSTSNDWKAQIVQHGYGDFAITDTLTGETEFQWRKP